MFKKNKNIKLFMFVGRRRDNGENPTRSDRAGGYVAVYFARRRRKKTQKKKKKTIYFRSPPKIVTCQRSRARIFPHFPGLRNIDDRRRRVHIENVLFFYTFFRTDKTTSIMFVTVIPRPILIVTTMSETIGF